MGCWTRLLGVPPPISGMVRDKVTRSPGTGVLRVRKFPFLEVFLFLLEW